MEFFSCKNGILIPHASPRETTKGHCVLSDGGLLFEKEGLSWLDLRRLDTALSTAPDLMINELTGLAERKEGVLVNTNWRQIEWWQSYFERKIATKKRVHLVALGDVGSTVLTTLKLLGSDCIEALGIYDVNPDVCQRWEQELNQAAYPWDYDAMPEVEILDVADLFECDVFIFCASKGVPPVATATGDVRMVQFEANRGIVSVFAKKARQEAFAGLFAVVSDPVDPLCKVAFLASNENDDGTFDGFGLMPEQIQGYGLGVMNARAAYYAKKDIRFQEFLKEGRAFGPHGEDLVIANSIENYNDGLSKELTDLTIQANLEMRELGFKPYVAPAISSAGISILLTLRGQWHYSSNFLGGVYMGSRNRSTPLGLEIEHLPLPRKLYDRLERAYKGLGEIL